MKVLILLPHKYSDKIMVLGSTFPVPSEKEHHPQFIDYVGEFGSNVVTVAMNCDDYRDLKVDGGSCTPIQELVSDADLIVLHTDGINYDSKDNNKTLLLLVKEQLKLSGIPLEKALPFSWSHSPWGDKTMEAIEMLTRHINGDGIRALREVKKQVNIFFEESAFATTLDNK